MADKGVNNGYNGAYYGGPYGGGFGMPPAPPSGKGKNDKKTKKGKKAAAKKAERRAYRATMRERQNFAVENAGYRAKISAIDGQGGIDSRYYHLPEDVKPKREKDYFFIMRKMVCFLMCIVLLVSVAYFALSVVKVDAIPGQYVALFMETEAKADDSGDATGDDENGDDEEANPENADGDEANEGDVAGEDGEGEGDENEAPKAKFDGVLYDALDPVFGFIKYIGNLVGIDLDLSKLTAKEEDKQEEGDEVEGDENQDGEATPENADGDEVEGDAEGEEGEEGEGEEATSGTAVTISIGQSPLYDSMISKVEVGMEDDIASYIMIGFPVAILIYIITALIMAFKAFFGMFGKRIYKGFGLGSIVMILCTVVVAFGGLAYTTPIDGKMDFAGIVNILFGAFTGVGGFTGGYGLVIMLVLPIITFIFGLFAKKKIPYSIFDTFGV